MYSLNRESMGIFLSSYLQVLFITNFELNLKLLNLLNLTKEMKFNFFDKFLFLYNLYSIWILLNKK